MLAHLLRLGTLEIARPKAKVAKFLKISVSCHAISLACGYFGKGPLISEMIVYAGGQKWAFPQLGSEPNNSIAG
jgi:hypothetical protein